MPVRIKLRHAPWLPALFVCGVVLYISGCRSQPPVTSESVATRFARLCRSSADLRTMLQPALRYDELVAALQQFNRDIDAANKDNQQLSAQQRAALKTYMLAADALLDSLTVWLREGTGAASGRPAIAEDPALNAIAATYDVSRISDRSLPEIRQLIWVHASDALADPNRMCGERPRD